MEIDRTLELEQRIKSLVDIDINHKDEDDITKSIELVLRIDGERVCILKKMYSECFAPIYSTNKDLHLEEMYREFKSFLLGVLNNDR